MIDITPQPILFSIGPIAVYWYGICYALGLAGVYAVLTRQAPRLGQDPGLIGNGMIVIAIAALVGGRLYHVIDQFNACDPGPCYRENLLKIVLPPYSGLGVYGGLVTGILAFIALIRYHRVSGWLWADVAAPALFVMQAFGRWGNFFNQELYGPPTNLPWGIAIDCAHRVTDHATVQYPCDQYPVATTHFTPLFLYESVSGFVGAAVLIWLSRNERARRWLRPGDLALIFFIWYAVVRFLLENLRTGNWRLGAMPTAQIFSLVFIIVALAIMAFRHARSRTEVPSLETAVAAATGEGAALGAGPFGAAAAPAPAPAAEPDATPPAGGEPPA